MILLFDYVENPRSLPGDINIVYTVPCARADVYGSKTCNQHGICTVYCTGSLPDDGSTIVPKRTDAVDHDLGLLDSALDGILIKNIKLEYLYGIVDWQADGIKLAAGPRGEPDGKFGAFRMFKDVACGMSTTKSSCADD